MKVGRLRRHELTGRGNRKHIVDGRWPKQKGHVGPAGIDLKLAIATQGKRINLPGGLPIIVDGHVIGGIGVGSGTGEQDKQVANAALAALPGAKRF